MNERYGRAKQRTNLQTRTTAPRAHQQPSVNDVKPSKCGSKPYPPLRQPSDDHFGEIRSIINGGSHVGGLSLELEIDESLRELLQLDGQDNGLKCLANNQALDVTFIQQADSHQAATVSLGVDEVSQLLDMVSATSSQRKSHRKQQQQQEDHGTRVTRSCERPLQRDDGAELRKRCDEDDDEEDDGAMEYCSSGDEYMSDDEMDGDDDNAYAQDTASCIMHGITQQVYTSPQHTFDQLQKKLPCIKSGEVNEKHGSPCLCQHCGMVGVLVESQKRPAIPHAPNPKFTGCQPHGHCSTNQQVQNQTQHQHHHSNRQNVNRKVVDLRTKSKSETNLILLKELTTKIASLEDRLNEHEEKTVRKDYFKFVITKLLTQYSNRINEIRAASICPTKESTNISTQYSRKMSGASNKHRYENEAPERDHNRYYQMKAPAVAIGKQPSPASHKSSQEDCSSEKYYKKIQRKITKRSAKTSPTRTDGANGAGTDGANAKNVYVTSTTVAGNDPLQSKEGNEHTNLSAHAIRNLCDLVYSKYCEKQGDVDVPEKLLQPTKPGANSKQQQQQQPNSGRKENAAKKGCDTAGAAIAKRMDVSYVSPSVKTWHDESDQEFAATANNNTTLANGNVHHTSVQHQPKQQQQQRETLNNASNDSNNKHSKHNGRHGDATCGLCSTSKNKSSKHTIEEKIKYLKFLAKKKNVDEAELWTNILNQAKRHIKSNADTVSIQLPNMVNGPDMSELELTLSKLKEIARRSRANVHKNKSGTFSPPSSSECWSPLASPRKPLAKDARKNNSPPR